MRLFSFLPVLFILCGQSNMSGSGVITEIPEEQRSIPAQVEFWDRGEQQTVFGASGYFGPEIGFTDRILKRFPERTFIIVKHSQGGTSMDDWLNGGLLTEALAFAQTAVAGRDVELGGFVWVQGERDSQFPDLARAYLDNLIAVRGRAESTFGPGPMFVALSQPPTYCEYYQWVIEAQARFPAVSPDGWIIPTYGCSIGEDGIHYDTGGQLELGRRIADAYVYRYNSRL